MDLTYGLEGDLFRAEVRAFLADYLPDAWLGVGALEGEDLQQFRSRWRRVLVEKGWLAPSVPKEYGGGGFSVLEQSILCEEFVRAGVPQFPVPNDSFGMRLLIPTVMHWGTENQKHRFVEPTIKGEAVWAQGYSEPEAGSDLFSLRTTAVPEGDEWVINGQKVWQTAGLKANWIFALVRTDPGAQGARGISFMLVPLDQPGVEVRGITNMVGEEEFAEVFFDNARTSRENVLGSLNEGAKVALTLLGFERGTASVATALSFRLELERLIELVKARGLGSDAVIADRLARLWSDIQVFDGLALRSLTSGVNGSIPGAESSIIKLVHSQHRHNITELAVEVLGAEGMTPTGQPSQEALGPQPFGFDPLSSLGWTTDLLQARPITVYGGSSEIQRNTIAEQILGLPRDARPSNKPIAATSASR